MNIDRSIEIYKTYSLAKISELNKQMLIAQYAQCEQIGNLENSLRKELNAINSTNQQILQNQLKEAKRQETIRYYRNLAHKIKESIDLIDEQKDLDFKTFLVILFKEPLILHLKDAKEHLEEIADKEFCTYWEKVLQNNISLGNHNLSHFNTSPYKTLLDTQEIFSEEERQLKLQITNKRIEKLRLTLPVLETPLSVNAYQAKGCITTMIVVSVFEFIFFLIGLSSNLSAGLSKEDIIPLIMALCLFVALPISILYSLKLRSNRKLNEYSSYLIQIDSRNQSKISEYEIAINNLDHALTKLKDQRDSLLSNHPYAIAKNNITQHIPAWQEVADRISLNIPEQYSSVAPNPTFDNLLAKIAHDVVSRKLKSISAIGKKYFLAPKRANIIMDQLEQLNIIEKEDRFKPIKVIIDEDILRNILECHRIF